MLKQGRTLALYPEPIRAVCCRDEETGGVVVSITNNFDITTLDVVNLYRHRRDIEVSIKWIKQDIIVKTLWDIPKMP